MSELAMLKKENMNLRKQLKDDNRKLFSDIDYYVSRHDISKKKYQLLINEVLVDFTERTNLGENLWDTIENPKEYCDKYTNKYDVKKKSWGIVVRDYSLLFIGFVCFYFILTNYFTPSANIQSNPWLIEVGFDGFIKCIAYSSYGFYYELMNRSNLFNRNKAFRYQNVFLIIGWVFTTFILLAISEMYIVTFTLPKVIIYLILLICITLVYLIQKKRLF